MQRIEVNCQTGEQVVVDLTQEEIDEINSRSMIMLSVLDQIASLEASITPRRLREALLGNTTFINDVDAQIAALRMRL